MAEPILRTELQNGVMLTGRFEVLVGTANLSGDSNAAGVRRESWPVRCFTCGNLGV